MISLTSKTWDRTMSILLTTMMTNRKRTIKLVTSQVSRVCWLQILEVESYKEVPMSKEREKSKQRILWRIKSTERFSTNSVLLMSTITQTHLVSLEALKVRNRSLRCVRVKTPKKLSKVLWLLWHSKKSVFWIWSKKMIQRTSSRENSVRSRLLQSEMINLLLL